MQVQSQISSATIVNDDYQSFTDAELAQYRAAGYTFYTSVHSTRKLLVIRVLGTQSCAFDVGYKSRNAATEHKFTRVVFLYLPSQTCLHGTNFDACAVTAGCKITPQNALMRIAQDWFFSDRDAFVGTIGALKARLTADELSPAKQGPIFQFAVSECELARKGTQIALGFDAIFLGGSSRNIPSCHTMKAPSLDCECLQKWQ